MTTKEIKEFLKEEVKIQKEIQVGNGERVYKGFSKEIKNMTLEALHQTGKITDEQYNKMYAKINK